MIGNEHTENKFYTAMNALSQRPGTVFFAQGFISVVGFIIGMDFILGDFIEALTSANHSQISHGAQSGFYGHVDVRESLTNFT